MAGAVVQLIMKDSVASPATLAFPVATTVGNWVVVFACDGSAANKTITVSDSVDGSYGAANTTVNDTTNGLTLSVYTHQVASSGTPTFTVTSAGDQVAFCAAQISGVTALNNSKGQHQTQPGNGADAISSGTIATSAISFAVAVSIDSDGTGGAPGAGTGFTSATGTNITPVTSWQFGSGLNLARVEWKASVASGSPAGTFTDATHGSTHNYDTLVAFLTEGSAPTVDPGQLYRNTGAGVFGPSNLFGHLYRRPSGLLVPA